ncbi:squalene/phytoene synthase family protein [Beggiatoa leptomitoformis]|uniref:Squalene synthase HpnD n=1 Tax=Beggiatoa leptomitoformis TaxID=288004 RepID=A0A2N9YAU5_9GAMM|nr:squalene/phytoene synthase family protein [Beggiatoa leptomitoformis]ALG67053.1 squalene synthase HpnD [Beggiatoa leptomitoformis]AUI67564.1 squalene synthase HpnD [Beggiatoa leptomitoformis]
MNPQTYCNDKVLRAGSSLYYSLRFIPSSQREALIALHALFIELSDVVEECHEPHLAQLKLDWWRNELAALAQGTAKHPVCLALSQPIERYQLPLHYFEELLDGIADNVHQPRYATFAQLETYCKRTAGILQLLCTATLGYQHESTLKYAEQLGIALQLSYFLRNLHKHLQQGRVYIPQTELAQFVVSEEALFNGQFSDTMQALFAFQATRIRAYFHSASKHLAKDDCITQRFGRIRTRLALATLQELETDGYQLLAHRITLTPLRKLWLTWWMR